MRKKHSVKHRRTVLLQKKQTMPEQWHYHEGGPARHHGVEAIRAPDSNPSSQYLNPEKKECTVCTDNCSISRFPTHPPTARCAHDADICRRCLRTWISTTFATKTWDGISCPICSEFLNYEEVHKLASPEVFRKYEKLSIKAALEAIPGFHWCITKGCKSGQVHEEATSKFRCVKCMKVYCTKHGMVWHKGETCKEFDYRANKKVKRDEEKLSKKLVKEISKICPGCKRPVEKSYGCDHMTCTKCRKEFCWQCLALYVKKDSQKLVTHRDDCFYSTNNFRRVSGTVWKEGFY